VRNRVVPGIAIAAALAFSAQTAEAQRPMTIGIAAGVSVPTSDFGRTHSTGWNATAGLGFNFPASNLGFRFEGFYNSFEGKGANPRATIAGGTANAVYRLGGIGIQPYAIGGVGAYNTKVEGGRSETDLGINAGFGLRFPLGTLNTFAEARLHAVSADPEDFMFVPIVFGIQF
jgi:hypothetical protein